MSAHEKLLSDFIDAWNAGRRPSVRDYLGRVPEGPDRDALADELGTWLETAPAPALGDEARRALRADPVVERVFAVVGDDAAAWPQALPRLRARAGLSVAAVARRLVEGLGLGGDAEAARAAAYLEEMEHGERRADRVSRRLLDALGGVLGIDGSALAALGGGAGAFRPSPAGGTLFRTAGEAGEWVAEDIEVLARAAMAPAPAPMDELDRLFDGGPQA
jgi:transcriptional regulator with XRE-family HTH domain